MTEAMVAVVPRTAAQQGIQHVCDILRERDDEMPSEELSLDDIERRA